MGKNQKRKIKSKIIYKGFTKINDIHFDWNLKPNGFFDGFPVPPFVNWAINFDRINSFNRNFLQSNQQIVWIGKDDIIRFLECLYTESEAIQSHQNYYFCSSSHPEYLYTLSRSNNLFDMVFVILGRTLDELDLIKLVMMVNEGKKIFVGPEIGIMSEFSRLLFFPFYPVETANCRFWHHSELLYLPLYSMGLPIRDIVEGCEEGFSSYRDEAMSTAQIVYQIQMKGIQRLYFIVNSYLVYALLKALEPLLEESLNGENRCFKIKIFTFESLKSNYLEQILSCNDRDVFFILNQSTPNQRLQVPINLPQKIKEDSYLGKELQFLNKQSFSDYDSATIEALQYQIKKNESSFIHLQYPKNDLYTLGLLVAYFYYFTCYSSWLRGYDVLNDPPFAEFDRLIRKFIKKH
ncbi:MAG: hypothetical protein GX428_04360 [Candidatus Atribacteria bacterium]|nr:hypothetical protein [Candidatus Atribacteria bacterium]